MNKSIITESDVDPAEAEEWLDALQSVYDNEGVERAQLKAVLSDVRNLIL